MSNLFFEVEGNINSIEGSIEKAKVIIDDLINDFGEVDLHQKFTKEYQEIVFWKLSIINDAMLNARLQIKELDSTMQETRETNL